MNTHNLYNFIKQSYNNSLINSEEIENAIKDLNILNSENLSKSDVINLLRNIDGYDSFFSTQQLDNIDYSAFKNHVFFDSAISKIDYSFDRILNYPYDKDEIENLKYNNNNDGYTQYVLEKLFPKYTGSAVFNGENLIEVIDTQGSVFSDYNQENNIIKSGILSPDTLEFSFQFWFKVKDQSEEIQNQILFSKYLSSLDNKEGYVCYINKNNQEEFLEICFLITVNKNTYIRKAVVENYSNYLNVNINVFNTNDSKNVEIYIDGNKYDNFKLNIEEEDGTSLQSVNFSSFYKNSSERFFLGGTKQQLEIDVYGNLEKTILFNNFKGEIDEFRFLTKNQSMIDIKKNMHKNIFSNSYLKLYLRFNEPGGDYINNFVCIDYSGNKMHGIFYEIDAESNEYIVVKNTSSFRNNDKNLLPMIKEKEVFSPVLIGSFPEITIIRENLQISASTFDEGNPNNIFKLIPTHYFVDSSNYQNLPIFSNKDAYNLPESILDVDTNQLVLEKKSSLNSRISANNHLVNICLIWARFFDQLKLYTSSIDKILNVDYDSINNKNSTSGLHIPLACKMMGISFSEIFPSITTEKISGENLNYNDIISDISIRSIQNKLWKRFLVNTQDFLKSKGTISSIESVFNSFGLDYTKFIDIQERTNVSVLKKDNNYSKIQTTKKSVNFSFKNTILEEPIYAEDILGNHTSAINKLSLKIDRVRKKETNQSKTSENIIEGLGLNWSLETFVKFNEVIKKRDLFLKKKNSFEENNFKYSKIQNIFNIDLTDSVLDQYGAILTLHHVRNNLDTFEGDLILNYQPVKNNSSYNQVIIIENIDLYDNTKYISVMQSVDILNNSIKITISVADVGETHVFKKEKVKSLIFDVPNLQQKIDTNNFTSINNNVIIRSGEFNYPQIITSFITSIKSLSFINTKFEGEILALRCWSKELSEKERKSHFDNIENIGEDSFNPLDKLIFDFNFSKDFDFFSQEENSYKMWSVFDNSSNNIILNNEEESLNSCTISTYNESILNQEDIFNINKILIKKRNIKVDQPITNNRVNIHSFKNEEYQVLTNSDNSFPSVKPDIAFNYDKVSFVNIEMSIVKLLNNDIENIISDLSLFNSKINNFMSKYEYNYKEIEVLREKYFSKFSDKNYINYNSLGNIFKFFDNIMNNILYDTLPYNTRYLGFNLVYESHALERHKYEYKNKDSINSIIDYENYHMFSRERLSKRRNTGYNNKRRQLN